ncbi:MAG: hypothetical protein R6U13_13745 [Desulfatiglandaceae bacterium]
MKNKQRLNLSILLIVLIALIGGLGYYYYSNKSTSPSGITPPASIIEKSGYLSPPDQEPIRPGYSESPAVETAESGHDQSVPSGSPLNGQPSLATSDTSETAGSKAPAPSDDRRESGVITGTIKHPGSSETLGNTPQVSTESGHLYPFSVPFGASNQPKPGDEGFCEAVESEMRELFSYLDKKNYTNPDSEVKISERFNEVAAALSASPPAPAGESLDPIVLFDNIYHIYRTFNINDIKILKNILRYERNDLELYMHILYRWFCFSDQCPETTLIRPSEEIIYLYAGFFVNTIGGRAIMFRRDPLFRILFTYYCTLIIHEADREKRNIYGIDLVPLIEPLKKQIAYYPQIIFRDHYLSELNKINNYYLSNR